MEHNWSLKNEASFCGIAVIKTATWSAPGEIDSLLNYKRPSWEPFWVKCISSTAETSFVVVLRAASENAISRISCKRPMTSVYYPSLREASNVFLSWRSWLLTISDACKAISLGFLCTRFGRRETIIARLSIELNKYADNILWVAKPVLVLFLDSVESRLGLSSAAGTALWELFVFEYSSGCMCGIDIVDLDLLSFKEDTKARTWVIFDSFSFILALNSFSDLI